MESAPSRRWGGCCTGPLFLGFNFIKDAAVESHDPKPTITCGQLFPSPWGEGLRVTDRPVPPVQLCVSAVSRLRFSIAFPSQNPYQLPMKYTIASFLVTMVVAVSSIAAEVGTGPSFKGPIGLQLYSLRAEFTRTVPATLEKVRAFGFKTVETAGTYNLSPEKFRELLDRNSLKAVSGHFPFERYRDDVEGVAKDAKTLGLEYVGCAWVPHEGDFDEKECRNAIEVFNKAGEALKKHNLKLFYHAHGYEFAPHGDGTFMDLMMKETRPENVRFQMDIFWVVHPGHDPVKWFEKYPKRWELVHLKDMKKGVKTGEFTGKTDVSNDVALGTGQMDWPAILRAAKKAGVKYYFIEDESPTVAEQIPQSLKYLEQVKF